MSRILNTTCKICGKKYHHCKDCERINSWRMIACSPECWNIWCDRIAERKAAERAAAEKQEQPMSESPDDPKSEGTDIVEAEKTEVD